MFVRKVNDIQELSIENQYIKVVIEGRLNTYPLVYGSYIDEYSDQDQNPQEYEQMIVGVSENNAVALLILKDYYRVINRNQQDLPLKL